MTSVSLHQLDCDRHPSQPAPPAASRARRASRRRGRRSSRRARSAARSAPARTPGMLRTERDSFSSSVDVDEHRLAGDAEPLQQLRRRLGLDLARPSARRRRPARRPAASAQRRAQRAALDLLRQLEVVAARLRPEHRAAVAPQRVADRPDARAAGALLPPRLLAAAADERAVLGRVRAAPLRRVRRARPTPRSDRVFTRPPNTSSRRSTAPTFSFSPLTTSSCMTSRCQCELLLRHLLLALLRLLDLRDLELLRRDRLADDDVAGRRARECRPRRSSRWLSASTRSTFRL